jgi:hypothetical protein
MLKLTLILLSALIIATCLLQLRQQRVELNYQTQRLHRQLQARQVELWNQQISIATFTAPNAILATVGHADESLISSVPLREDTKPAWIDAAE